MSDKTLAEILAQVREETTTPAWRALQDSTGYLVFERPRVPVRPQTRWERLLRLPVYDHQLPYTVTFKSKVIGSAKTLDEARAVIDSHRANGEPVPFWENPVAYAEPATEPEEQIESD